MGGTNKNVGRLAAEVADARAKVNGLEQELKVAKETAAKREDAALLRENDLNDRIKEEIKLREERNRVPLVEPLLQLIACCSSAQRN